MSLVIVGHHGEMGMNASSDREVVGVMTGTSIDAMDAALVRIGGTGSALKVEMLRHRSASLGPVAARLRAAAEQRPMTCGEFASLSRDFGSLHADVIGELLDGRSAPHLIAVHGQTVFHQPPVSWQLINPAPVAARFGCPVVYELRQGDLAVGGQGAPITPAADWVLFRDGHNTRAIVNLGGFCNVSILPPAGSSIGEPGVQGFDVCACNQVLDAVARAALGQPYDEGGQAARAGDAHHEAVQQLLSLLRQQRLAGRSLGTGDEAVAFVGQWHSTLSGNDIAASAVAAVAHCIGEALLEKAVDEIFYAGGGCRNAALLAKLAAVTARPTRLIDELGVPAEYREAVCIAVLGDLAFTSRSGCSIAWPKLM